MTIRRFAAKIRQAFAASLNRAQARALFGLRNQLAKAARVHNEALAADGRYTVALFMTRVLGVGKRFARKYASAFGRVVSKTAKLLGLTPALDGLTVIGNHPRFKAIAVYDPATLAAAAPQYKRLAALIGA
jgi:hypothetical protein